VRVVLLAFILVALARGLHDAVFFHATLFLAFTPAWLVRDTRALFFEALLLALFATTLGLALFASYALPSSVFGWDKLFHFLAGVALAGLAWTAAPHVVGVRRADRLAFVALACSVLFLGWEVYEWFFYAFLGGSPAFTLVDTWLDVVVDTAGAFLALRLVRA
jgi:hypothetical protein